MTTTTITPSAHTERTQWEQEKLDHQVRGLHQTMRTSGHFVILEPPDAPTYCLAAEAFREIFKLVHGRTA